MTDAQPAVEPEPAAEPVPDITPDPEPEAGPKEKGPVAPFVIESVDPLNDPLLRSAEDQCVPAVGESQPEKAEHDGCVFVDAAEKRALQVADAQFDKLAFSGTGSKPDTERETVLHREAGVAVRLMDRSVYAGVLFITTYRVALFSPQLPNECTGLGLVGLTLSPWRVPTHLLPARHGR
jgi:hypothetical protein